MSLLNKINKWWKDECPNCDGVVLIVKERREMVEYIGDVRLNYGNSKKYFFNLYKYCGRCDYERLIDSYER